MNLLKQYFLQKFKIDFDSLSLTKQYSLRAFFAFNKLAEPEIKSNLMKGAHDLVTQWVGSKIIKKSDEELKPKIMEVLMEMGPLLNDAQMAAEVKAMEKLGSVNIPRVGQLAKKLDLVKVDNEEQALQILKRLMK